jgi:hypothetical protein
MYDHPKKSFYEVGVLFIIRETYMLHMSRIFTSLVCKCAPFVFGYTLLF